MSRKHTQPHRKARRWARRAYGVAASAAVIAWPIPPVAPVTRTRPATRFTSSHDTGWCGTC